jgi:hypothetical protein
MLVVSLSSSISIPVKRASPLLLVFGTPAFKANHLPWCCMHAEIDEAVKMAQPELDRLEASKASSTDTAAPAPGMFSEPVAARPLPPPANFRVREPSPMNQQVATASGQHALQNARDGSEWWRVALASAVVVGLGSGLGIFVRRMLAKGSGGFWGSEKRNEEAAYREQENSRTMGIILEKLESLQGSISQTNRSIEQVSTPDWLVYVLHRCSCRGSLV